MTVLWKIGIRSSVFLQFLNFVGKVKKHALDSIKYCQNNQIMIVYQ